MNAQDNKSVYQNSGAMIEAKEMHKVKKVRYLCMIEEVWELEYNITKIPMICVRWVKQKDVTVEDQNFTTIVLPPPTTIESRQVHYIPPKDEPWVLAK